MGIKNLALWFEVRALAGDRALDEIIKCFKINQLKEVIQFF